MMNHIAIVGGGIAGLASAYYAHKKAASLDIPLKISLLEADSYWGGKILTKRVNGFCYQALGSTVV
jgi:protoporphyrinogen oxidase